MIPFMAPALTSWLMPTAVIGAVIGLGVAATTIYNAGNEHAELNRLVAADKAHRARYEDLKVQTTKIAGLQQSAEVRHQKAVERLSETQRKVQELVENPIVVTNVVERESGEKICQCLNQPLPQL